MQIPRRVDYGLRAVIYLAIQDPEKCCSITEIAKQQGVPKKFLKKIIQDLLRCGLIKSKRGCMRRVCPVSAHGSGTRNAQFNPTHMHVGSIAGPSYTTLGALALFAASSRRLIPTLRCGKSLKLGEAMVRVKNAQFEWDPDPPSAGCFF